MFEENFQAFLPNSFAKEPTDIGSIFRKFNGGCLSYLESDPIRIAVFPVSFTLSDLSY